MSFKKFKDWYDEKFMGPFPVLYLIAISMIVFPLLFPIGIPISVGKHAKLYYDFIEKQEPGGIYINFASFLEPSNYPEVGYAAEAAAMHIFEKGGKILFIPYGAAMAVPGYNMFMMNMIPEFEAAGLVYGVDYAHLFIISGTEALTAFAKDMYFLGTDFYGTSLEDLPIMEEIKGISAPYDVADMNDITALFCYGSVVALGEWCEPYKGAGETYNGRIPYVMSSYGCGAAMAMAYYPEWIVSNIVSIAGAAEYMLLRGDYRFPVKAVDVLTMCMLLAVVYMVGGNIWGYLQKEKRKVD